MRHLSRRLAPGWALLYSQIGVESYSLQGPENVQITTTLYQSFLVADSGTCKIPSWARTWKKSSPLQTERTCYTDRKDMKMSHDALKTVYGPKSSRTTPFLSADESTLLTDKDGILERWADASIVCWIAHQLSMALLSTDCHWWSAKSGFMNSQLSLKQRKQFSICHRARPHGQTQYL